jgi:hypothetical protein
MAAKKTVYLCGGINKLSDTQAKDWREASKSLLVDFNILDPMRRDYRGKEADNIDDIVLGDLADIGSSDIILAKVSTPSWGTAMEIRTAWIQRVPIYAFGAGDRPSPWLAYHCDLYSTLEEAVDKLIAEASLPTTVVREKME